MLFENKDKTSLQEIGEFGLIDHIHKAVKLYPKNKTQMGIGDDAAVMEKDEHRFTLLSTDQLVEGVHFDMMYTPLKHLGYKAVVVNLSDICAMNGKPEQITVSIAISSKYTLEAIEELYQGIILACEKYEIDLVGGDTTSIHQGMVINISCLGSVQKEKIAYRKGAQPNDLICVSGDLGGAYMGLQVLEREKQVFMDNPKMQPDLEKYDYIVGRQLKPEARLDVIELLEKLNIQPTAMIDVSDGLSSDLMHLAKHSKVGTVIYEEKLPVDQQTFELAREFDFEMTLPVLHGGEDYELLFTISQQDFEKVKDSMDFSVIGFCTDQHEGAQLISRGGQQFELKSQGWNAFK